MSREYENIQDLRKSIYRKSVIGLDYNEIDKTKKSAEEALNFLAKKGLIKEDYPYIKSYEDVKRLIYLKNLVINLERPLIETLQDNSIDRYISLIPTTRCYNNCVHCLTNSTSNGTDLDYILLENADPRFFNIFSGVHFGREGDHLIVSSKNKRAQSVDLSDYISLLHNLGIKKFVFDAKNINGRQKIRTYKKIKDFFKSTPGIAFHQRISFNLYSPKVYKKVYDKKDVTEELKSEFLPLLHAAMEFADEITINTVGSYKYTRSHLIKTVEYLCKIMEEEGLKTVRQHFRKIFFREDPDYNQKEIEECERHGEPFIISFGTKKSEIEIEEKIGFNPLEEIFSVKTNNKPKGLNVLPTYFFQKETGRIIKFRQSRTINMGRWLNTQKGDDTMELDPYRKINPTSPRSICNSFLTERVLLTPDSTLHMCGGGYYKSLAFGRLSDSWEDIYSKMQKMHEATRQFYKQNLKDIVTGRCNNWLCDMER